MKYKEVYFRVAVSAGHHEAAQGATYEGVTEYMETTVWQQELIDQLENENRKRYPHIHVLTEYIEHGRLPDKVRQINQADCDLAIEIHFNAAANVNAKGAETLYFPGSDKGLHAAQFIQLPMAEAMETKSRGCKPGWYRMDRPGVVDFYGDEDGDEMPDYFLRATNCTALILEPEFLSQIEYIRLRRQACCFAIAKAIMNYAGALHEQVQEAGPT